MSEEWRRCPTYPLFEVTQDGRVRYAIDTKKHPAGYEPQISEHNLGYLRVSMPNGRRRGKKLYTQRGVHVLVADAWIGPCPDGLEINHRDGDKHNNAVDNLEYVTHAQNQAHAKNVLGKWSNMLKGENHPNHKLTAKQVYYIKLSLRDKLMSYPELAEMYDVDKETIYMIASGRTWKHVTILGGSPCIATYPATAAPPSSTAPSSASR